MAQERSGAATVIEQQSDQLRVEHEKQEFTARMRGFPQGFRLDPGSLVILFDDANDLLARPLVRTTTSRVVSKTLQQGGPIEVKGRRLELQKSTILDEPPSTDNEPSEEHVLWIIERSPGEQANQVIAARRSR